MECMALWVGVGWPQRCTNCKMDGPYGHRYVDIQIEYTTVHIHESLYIVEWTGHSETGMQIYSKKIRRVHGSLSLSLFLSLSFCFSLSPPLLPSPFLLFRVLAFLSLSLSLPVSCVSFQFLSFALFRFLSRFFLVYTQSSGRAIRTLVSDTGM